MKLYPVWTISETRTHPTPLTRSSARKALWLVGLTGEPDADGGYDSEETEDCDNENL